MTMETAERLDLFWPKVRVTPACWEWTAYVAPDGYARFKSEEGILAHRFAYKALMGPIPEGLTIDHLCRNRACVNPSHMEVVTHAVNSHRRPGYSDGVQCVKGHRLTPENSIPVRGRPGVRCRECRLDYRRGRNARLKLERGAAA